MGSKLGSDWLESRIASVKTENGAEYGTLKDIVLEWPLRRYSKTSTLKTQSGADQMTWSRQSRAASTADRAMSKLITGIIERKPFVE